MNCPDGHLLVLRPAEKRVLAAIQAELSRVIRYDDESIVHDTWIRQRYDGGFPSFAPARKSAVGTAWHEAGHAVAALTVGARFSSASIRHGRDSAGADDLAFVVDAAGQIAERLMNWTMLESDDALREWLPTWQADGGDAKRFRRNLRGRFGSDEFSAWRYSEEMLAPLRLKIRLVARALLVHPQYVPYNVVAAIAAGLGSTPS